MMQLYKHSDTSFTLITSDKRIYGLAQQGPKFITANYVGKASKEYRSTGKLLKNIPNFLKSKVFKLNKQ